MKIQAVSIKNFRLLKDVTIDFDSVTTLIGPNGTGKSTVLRALDWFFNGGKSFELGKSDCCFGETEEDIEVIVTFTDLTEKDHEALGNYAPSSDQNFTVWKLHHPDRSETLCANVKRYEPFENIRGKSTASEKREAYNQLRATDPNLELPAWTNQDAAQNTMTEWESNNTDKLREVQSDLPANFFGFNSDAKMSGVFDYVLVTADLRATEEIQDTKSSIIGRILERSIDRTVVDEEIKKIIDDSREAQQKVCGEKLGPQLNGIKDRLNQLVSGYSLGRSVSLTPSELDIKVPKVTFDLSIRDGSLETAVDGQGHGFQRTLLISALQLLAESTTSTNQGVFCLAIEEPELFQHPTQAQAFARVLRALSKDSNKRVQVAYATHSPYFIEARYFDQIRRFTRSAGEQPVVTVSSSTVDKVKERLQGIQDSNSIERQLDALTTGPLSSALFADRALVVEGTTDSAVFYGVGDRMGAAKLETTGVAVVPANSKSSIPLTHAVLTSLGIPSYAVFDADSGFEERAKANGKTEEKIQEERKFHVFENKKLEKYFTLEEEDFPSQIVSDKVAVFEDCLEVFLNSEWPEWTASCKAVEEKAGIPNMKNQLAYRVATAEAKGTIPEMITQMLEKMEALQI